MGICLKSLSRTVFRLVELDLDYMTNLRMDFDCLF